MLVDVTFDEGLDETYAVPLVLGGEGAAPGALAMTLDLDGVTTRALDAFDDPGFCLELLTAFERNVTVPTLHQGAVRFVRTELFPPLAGVASLTPRRLTAEQSNTSVVYGESRTRATAGAGSSVTCGSSRRRVSTSCPGTSSASSPAWVS